ncbi:MAG: AI-2E family transporter [Acidimicrobiia bacterium]
MNSDRLRRAGLVIWIAVGAVILGYVVLVIAEQIRVIWLPVVFAAGLVFLLEPVVKTFERIRMPRVVAVILAFVVLVALIIAALALVAPTIREQAVELAQTLPQLYVDVIDWLRETGSRFGLDVDQYLSQQAIEDWLNDPGNQETIQQIVFGFGAGAGQVIRGVTEVVAIIGLAPVLALYVLIDLKRFKENALNQTPPKYQEEVAYVGGEVGGALGSFVRGQLLVAVIVGILSSIGMYLIDLPFWLIIGLLAGFLNLIPFLGPIVGGALAVLVALLNGDPWQGVWAVVIFVVIQQVDNHVITPMIQRTRVNLSPLVIVLALVVGGSVAGLLGVLVAVPLTAAIRILVGHIWRTRVLGQSWKEASDAMIEVTVPPERLARISRKAPAVQTRLFDTQEIAKVKGEDEAPPGSET